MLRQEIGCEMIWQNDGRRSDLLVSWEAVGKTERVKHKRGVWYGKPENSLLLLAPSPSLLLSLAIFRAASQRTLRVERGIC